MSAVSDFNRLVAQRGSPTIFHRDDSIIPCPCRTPEGFRDPLWHLLNPEEVECNEAGMLPSPVEVEMRAFIQPVQSGAVRRLTSEQLITLFGEIEADDHLAIFPCVWNGQPIDFYNWGSATEDWIAYNGRKYTVVSTNLIPSPDIGGPPHHHWEIGLRLIGAYSG